MEEDDDGGPPTSSTTTTPIATPDELIRCVALASSPLGVSPIDRTWATSKLDDLRTRSTDGGAAVCLALLHTLPPPMTMMVAADLAAAEFFALTALQSSLRRGNCMTDGFRADLREVLFRRYLGVGGGVGVAVAEGRFVASSTTTTAASAVPTHVRTKVGVLLALLIQADYPHRWPNAFDDLMGAALPNDDAASSSSAGWRLMKEDLYLKALIGISDEVVYPSAAVSPDDDDDRGGAEGARGSPSSASLPSPNGAERNSRIKDAMRGIDVGVGGGGNGVTAAARIVESLLGLLRRYRPYCRRRGGSSNGGVSILGGSGGAAEAEEGARLAVSSLSVLKRYASWIDVSLLVRDENIGNGGGGGGPLELLYDCVGDAGPGGTDDDDVDADPATQLAVEAAQCVAELVSRGMDERRKVRFLARLDVLGRLLSASTTAATTAESSSCSSAAPQLNLDTVDATHIDAVIAVAELVNATGLELVSAWEQRSSSSSNIEEDDNGEDYFPLLQTMMHQCAVLFFKLFSYDDIDVSGAVLPLASRFVSLLETEMAITAEGAGGVTAPAATNGHHGAATAAASVAAADGAPMFRIADHASRLLSSLRDQMRYPPEFRFDYEDETEAEEESYRFDLRKLYIKVVRACPGPALEFLCGTLSSLPTPLSSSSARDLEVALRLVHHYGEGIRPPPGMKTVLRDETFRSVLIALHSSDVTCHPHREVVLLFYDLAARYHPLLKDRPDLLPPLLDALSGSKGLQHPTPRVRSRSCYLLLKLVKALGRTLRPYVETAVGGIQGLLSNPTAFPLEPDDTLYLFETMGLLLGKTGLPPDDQRRYLAATMTPHVQSIEEVLRNPNLPRDPEHYGDILSRSVAAIAYLSKGFTRPGVEVQSVLLETVGICLSVLRSLPGDGRVRAKCTILLQRMILCLGDGVLPSMPGYLELLVGHCNAEDVLDVAQLLMQLCAKFRERAAPAIDASVVPFLRRCHALIDEVVAGGRRSDGEEEKAAEGRVVAIPPHVLTEQLSIRKLTFAFLQHVVHHDVTPVLLSPSNAPSLEGVIQSMGEGATSVPDPVMKKACLAFFRDLIDQWATDGSLGGEHLAVQAGFVRFIFEAFVPGMMRCIMGTTFNERDALQARNVSEFGQILSVLKARRGAAEFEQQVIVRTLGDMQLPLDIISGFQSAASGKDMEVCLKALMSATKQR